MCHWLCQCAIAALHQVLRQERTVVGKAASLDNPEEHWRSQWHPAVEGGFSTTGVLLCTAARIRRHTLSLIEHLLEQTLNDELPTTATRKIGCADHQVRKNAAPDQFAQTV